MTRSRFFTCTAVLLVALIVGVSDTRSAIIWKAGMETGDVSEWGPHSSQDTQPCHRTVTTKQPRTGAYSLRLAINTSGGKAGCRQHRNAEARTGKPYYYSAWYYVPFPRVPVSGMWNIFQFKSNARTADARGSDPFWTVNMTRNPLRFTLKWKGGQSRHARGVRGPFRDSTRTAKTWHSQVAIPVRHWFHLEAFLVQSGRFDGTLSVWVDDTQLWHFTDVRTKWSHGDQRWSVNNYSNGLRPSFAALYVDDAAISASRTG